MTLPTQPRRKVRAHRTRAMWANFYEWTDCPITVHLTKAAASKGRGWPCAGNGPVYVIMADPASVEAMIETGAKAMHMHFLASIKAKGPQFKWTRLPFDARARYMDKSRALLTSLGLTAKKP